MPTLCRNNIRIRILDKKGNSRLIVNFFFFSRLIVNFFVFCSHEKNNNLSFTVKNDNIKTKEDISNFESKFLHFYQKPLRDMNAVSPWWKQASSGGTARAASEKPLRSQLPCDPRFFSACCCCWVRPPEKPIIELHTKSQSCGSGSGIRCLFDPGSGIGFSDPGSQTHILDR